MKRARGSTTLLVSMVLLSLLALGGLFAMRLEVHRAGTRAQQARLAALWLARSALTAGVTGTSTVKVAQGEAVVQVAAKSGGREAIVTLRGGRATVTATKDGWTERYTTGE